MKKRFLLMGATAVLVMSAVVGGTLAAGQATAENPVTAPLAAATLNIEWNGQQNISAPVLLEMQNYNLMPADIIELTNTYSVKNTGSVDSYIRVTVTKYWTDESGNKMPELDASNIYLQADTDNWLQAEQLFGDQTMNETQVFYYKYPVAAGQSTADLLKQIEISASIGNEYTNKKVQLEAVADAVQFAGANESELNAKGILASWGVAATFDANGNLTNIEE